MAQKRRHTDKRVGKESDTREKDTLYHLWEALQIPLKTDKILPDSPESPLNIIADLKNLKDKQVINHQEAISAPSAGEASDSLLQKTCEKTSGAVLIVEPNELIVVYCNKATEEILGYHNIDALGKDTRFLFENEHDYGKFWKTAVSSLKKNDSFSAEWKMKRKDGSLFPVGIQVTRIFNEAGEYIYGVELIQDRTALKRTDDEFTHPQEMLRIAEKISNMGSWEWKLDLNKIILSTNACSIYGIDPEDFDGTIDSLLKKIHPDDRENVIEKMGRLNKEQKKDLSEYRIINADNEERILSVSYIVRRSDKGKIARIIALIQDITELKTADAALRKSMLSESMLRDRAGSLENINSVLRKLIKQCNIEKESSQKNIAKNIHKRVLPLVKKMKAGKVKASQLSALKESLEKLASSFERTITVEKFKLHPIEMEICSLIRGGLTNRDIAEHLHLSVQVIEKHRKEIRQKFGTTNKRVNLRSYLQSI